jgi:hypothetical protein
MGFVRAVKRNVKLKMAIAGIAGSGKTLTSLILAKALANGGGVALIDTEHGSASKYADEFVFDVLELSQFDPRNYIKAIHEAEKAGYTVLIIDSLSHAWNGTGGALELVDIVAKKAAARRNKDNPNTFNAWSEVTPLQNRMVDTILASPLHIIATMRSKTEYLVKVINGNSVPQKLGMAPIQRADVEYEFDIYADMDADNTMVIQKSRFRTLSGQVIPKPDADLAEVIRTWLAGVPAEVAPVQQDRVSPPASQHPPLDEQIKQVKLRAQRLDLAHDGEEWANLLAKCDVSIINSAADLAKVIEYMDQFERDALLATPEQISSIKELCASLHRPAPVLDGITSIAAKDLIQQLTKELQNETAVQ